MNKTTLLWASCTMLFACSSLEATAQPADSLLAAKLDHLRHWHQADAPEDQARALLAASEAAAGLGQWAHAQELLEAAPWPFCPEPLARDLLRRQAALSYLSGEFALCLALQERMSMHLGDSVLQVPDLELASLALAQLQRWDEAHAHARAAHPENAPALDSLFARAPKALDPEKARKLATFLPGFGHAYAGEWGEGMLNLGLNFAALGFGLWQGLTGFPATGYLVGAGLLQKFYMGGIRRATFLAQRENHLRAQGFVEQLKPLVLPP